MANKNTDVKYKSSNGFCDVACLRMLLIAFNFIFVLTGAFVFGLGIWTIATKMQYVALLGSIYYNLVVALLIVAGCLVFITGILGCIGALRKNNSILTWYFILLGAIFVFELVAGILAFVYHESIHDELSTTMRKNLNKNYNQTGQDALSKAVDMMQQDFQCCGVTTYSDWSESAYIKQNKEGLKVPTSCCKTPSPTCSRRDHPSNIYRVTGVRNLGCLITLEEYIRENLFFLAVAGIAVAFFEILVVLVACGFRRQVRIENSQSY